MEMVAKPERPTETGAAGTPRRATTMRRKDNLTCVYVPDVSPLKPPPSRGRGAGGRGPGFAVRLVPWVRHPTSLQRTTRSSSSENCGKREWTWVNPLVHRRSELPEPQQGFVLELLVSLGLGQWRKRALIACYRQDGAVGQEIVTQLPSRLTAAKADVGMIVATGDFDAAAVAAAPQSGIVLLQVIDGRKAYDSSGWGAPGHYPAWLPAHALQFVESAPDGTLRSRPLEARVFQGE